MDFIYHPCIILLGLFGQYIQDEVQNPAQILPQ